jgi:hypothetical protein
MIDPVPGTQVRRKSNNRPAWSMTGGVPRRDYAAPTWTLTGRAEKIGRSSIRWECKTEQGAVEWIEAKRLEEV